ncbi:hypothetical protein HPB47_011430 [Ixodes persulcatus]|uniref:Uncharacterized protein n=1 Tax=Ixodes persulcatus TaxID=34615 RepID=A0AC60NWH3_IXOPE|nr:hypothetical protein HPB47_011430 [Ixodes persulcatus]
MPPRSDDATGSAEESEAGPEHRQREAAGETEVTRRRDIRPVAPLAPVAGGKPSQTPPIPRGSTQQHRRTESLSRNNKVREPLRSTLHPTHASRPKFMPQWNCRSLQRKRASLTQYLNTLDRKPDVILQDTQGTHNLPQYTPYTQPSITQTDRRQNTYTPTLVTAYISKEHPSIQLNTTDINTAHQEHVINTLQPRNCPNPITIVNAYWRPGCKVANPTPWLTKLVANNTDHDILLVGDFNSPNVSWGYPNTQHNGRLLEQVTAQTSMALANDTTQPTRIGNSVERDTNPDLAFHHGPSVAEWSASDEQLGSDHRLIHLTLITNVKQKAQNKCTKEAQTTTATPYIDTHLLNLWKSRRKLVKKWKKTKHSKHLKHKIHNITKEAEIYAEQLTTENWLQLCDSLNGQLGTKQTTEPNSYPKNSPHFRHSSTSSTTQTPATTVAPNSAAPQFTSPQTNTTLRQTYTEAPSADLLETQALCSAIHHAIANPHEGHTSITVLTDSQKAVRTFQYNQLPNYMSRELRATLNTTPTLRFYIYWIPGHALIPGNERAHSLSRVTFTPGPAIDLPTSYDPQLQRNEYHQQRSDTLRQLRESRLALVPPPPTLSRQQASTLRRAQTHTLSSPHYTHLFQGAQGTAKCPFCTGYPNNTHTYWQCLHAQPSIRSTLSKLPPGLRPTTWKEWLSPTNHQHVPAIFDALLHPITTIEEKLKASKDATNPP